jgi:hypothetical protein
MSVTSTRLITCEWCGTVNDADQHRCVLCDIEIGIPTLDGVSSKDLDAALASTYTRGGAHLIAERLVDGRLAFRNTWRERQCIRFALAELLPELQATLTNDRTGKLAFTYLGWRWPESSLATQLDVGIYRGGRVEGARLIGGKKIRSQRHPRFPRRKAENLYLSVPPSSDDITVSISLLTSIEARVIGTHPRVVHSSRS